uniref:S-methyl-5'-thioadenosine phosphorylase n=1 Tax=Lotharella globosa TaxID=91324 RepID=A0A7S3Z8J3_9EUKA|mmetsp:Transcript_20876/g.40362  ORF Transcript_20876/g.40362 Transcript_20876/m.40362 type:complete len:299 (+) Transcript_20876:55-951(+)|eukprot:CAMPEP_0167788290 /NCGR_PEP_ID=MMETSP0111_2-20121227/9953_1 /TAXON_ID=91324 /ORGANISM="Lotharella globosa, Strain CCCM811" /LENGTH=298 /DNA_ID=CAMNT_0007680141 /DNA_START=23 /DNA_END=919 /DNA_ORIENTATION=-
MGSQAQDLPQIDIGIIGGSGLYKMTDLKDVKEIKLTTPYGDPSDAYITGVINGVKVVFLARHARGHKFLPHELPYQANIYGMKMLGVKYILSCSAVGSLKQEHKPMDMVIIDQFIDRTKARPLTFFGEGLCAHVAFGHPICPKLADIVYKCASSVEMKDVTVHKGGTYVCMEGPQFSTKAESNLYRSWGANVIGMTNLTEAKLAIEAEIAYATVAMVTDYDCWHEDHDNVTVEMVIEYLTKNALNAQHIVKSVVTELGKNPPKSAAHDALKFAILGDPNKASEKTKTKMAAILDKYLK